MSHKKQGEHGKITKITDEDKKDFKSTGIEGTKGAKEEEMTEEEKKKKLEDEIAKIVGDGPMTGEKVLAIEKVKKAALPPAPENPEKSKPITGEAVLKDKEK